MKIKNVIRFSIIAMVSIIVFGILGLLVWSKAGTYPARTVALSALKSTENVKITRDEFIVFTPITQTKTGLIFYPGGLVEPVAYAPVLHRIAEEGVLVVITPMPFNLAIFNTGAAKAIINDFPHISNWIITGHSLGGASAAIFVENNPTKIDAIAFWDSYPPNSADLSDNNLSVLSIFGTRNGFPNTDNFNEKMHLIPEDAIYVAIEGANHSQFGDYGPQKDDVVASISMTEQHEIVTEIMLDFIFNDK